MPKAEVKWQSLPEWAATVGLDRSNANRLANAGRISGAVKIGRNWAVPEGTPKPDALPMGGAAHKTKQGHNGQPMKKYRVTPDHFDLGPKPQTVLLLTDDLTEARARAAQYVKEFSHPAWVAEWSEAQAAYVVIETVT